jgi:hypothetical protein
MSRRSHHGGRHHGRPHKAAERRPAAPSTLAPGAPPQVESPTPDEPLETPTSELMSIDVRTWEGSLAPVDPAVVDPEPALPFEPVPMPSPEPVLRVAPLEPPPVEPDTHLNGEAHAEPHGPTNGDGLAGTCTAPQLRRFIKSRAYVPMHELRRRFAINGSEDDVTQVDVHARRIYIGLPEREGRLLGELLRGGDVGFELSLDPITPIVVGVYPMRPVPRP